MAGEQQQQHSESYLLEGLRTIGHMTDAIPLTFRFGYNLKDDGRVYAAIGNSFQSLRLPGLQTGHIGPQLKGKINCMHVQKIDNHKPEYDYIFCGIGAEVVVFHQTELVARLTGHSQKVVKMLVIGRYLLTFGEDQMFCLWNIEDIYAYKKNGGHIEPMVTHTLPDQDYLVTSVIHPETYLDKVLIGTKQGYLDLYNIRVGKLVHRFGPFEVKMAKSQQQLMGEEQAELYKSYAQITCLEKTGIMDVVLVGLSDGRVLIYNLMHDKILTTFKHKPSVVAMSIHKDKQLLATGNDLGDVAIWDLKEQQLVRMISHAHSTSIVSVEWIPRHPLLVTSGEDNSISIYEFEKDDHPILLRKLEGHARPPNRVSFYGPMGNWLLSSGDDRQLRITTTDPNQVSFQFSHRVKARAKREKQTISSLMLPPIVDMDYCWLRSEDWSNVVTAHQNSPIAYLWSAKNRNLSKKSLFAYKDAGIVTSVSLSLCGNYAFIGRNNGILEKWAVQSATKRTTTFKRKGVDTAHEGPITGVVVSNMNEYVVSAGYDCKLYFWDYSNGGSPEFTMELPSPPMMIRKHEHGNMLALALSDFSILIVDMANQTVVRHFKEGHRYTINDISFSPDGRYVCSVGSDKYIIIWDMLSGLKVDWLEVPSPATSISFHPKGLYLATTHVNTIGISLWVNKLTFGATGLQHARQPKAVSLPMNGEIVTSEIYDSDDELEDLVVARKRQREDDSDEDMERDPEQRLKQDVVPTTPRADEYVTLSGVAKHRWYGLTQLERLREKHETFEKALNSTEKLPFFLETTYNDDDHFKTEFIKEDAFNKTLPIEQQQQQPIKKVSEEKEKKQPESDKPQGDFMDLSDSENSDSDNDDDNMTMDPNEPSHILKKRGKVVLPASSTLLGKISDESFDSAVAFLRASSLKHLDTSIRVLSSVEHFKEYKQFLTFLLTALEKGIEFDLVQGLIKLFVECHFEILMRCDDGDVLELLAKLRRAQDNHTSALDALLLQTRSMVCMLTGVQ